MKVLSLRNRTTSLIRVTKEAKLEHLMIIGHLGKELILENRMISKIMTKTMKKMISTMREKMTVTKNTQWWSKIINLNLPYLK